MNSLPLGSRLSSSIKSIQPQSNENGETVYYVAFLEPQGIVLVSANDHIEPIIGFFPEAESFSTEKNLLLVTMVNADMKGRAARVQAGVVAASQKRAINQAIPEEQQKALDKWNLLLPIEYSRIAATSSAYVADAVDDMRVAPFIASRWSQNKAGGDNCYNYYTPNNYPSGCVSTAMSQLMRYHQYPLVDVGTPEFTIIINDEAGSISQEVSLQGGDGNGGPYDWGNMPLEPDSETAEAQCQQIGAIISDAGVSVGTTYSSGASSASTQEATIQLRETFKYTNSVFGSNLNTCEGTWQNLDTDRIEKMINTNLDARLPVILSVSGPSGGHALLVDGYGENMDTSYHHLNLGWGGYDDGWYNLPDIDTSSYTFDIARSVVYNIFREGDGEIISGHIIDNSGDPVSGVSVTAQSNGIMYQATTDSNGVYAIQNVPSESDFTITAVKGGIAISPFNRQVSTGLSKNNWDYQYYLEDCSCDWNTVGNVWGVDFTGTPVVSGDLDGSGETTLHDALLGLQLLSGSTTFAPDIYADVDGDARIGQAEVLYILKTLAE
ncbi:C10 family peptidase [Desulfosediminicola flagellatus]|uniref:C10 family peptidase n=1 Tax=Desulfosediminicola flagellatus TaxID=2569541 RepID=UPI00226A075B|nr:C10 family peptidase [Desulfosediminicola flagellatus]